MAKRPSRTTLALQRAVFADRQFPRFKTAILAQLKDQVARIARVAALGGKLKINDDLRADWADEIIRVLKTHVYAMTAHGWTLASVEVGATAKAQIGGVEVGALPKDFLTKADFSGIDKWVKSTAVSAADTSSRRLENIFSRAAAFYDEEKQQGLTPKDIAAQILAEGLAQCESRARTLAHTGAIWSYNEGAVQRYTEAGVAVVEWLTADDDLRCPFCAEMNGKKIDTGEPFFRAGDSMTVGEGTMTVPSGARGFDIRHPPLHPNCRCTLVPVFAEELS